ncbi:MAG: glycosyltransferase family 4 protein [Nitrososphaerota archaeon]|nr:glycosyltransferase family 4 protein [Nitrososphaerota archaeon]
MAKGLVANGVSVTVVAGVPHYPDGKVPSEYRWKPLAVENQRGLRVIRTFLPPLPSKGFGRRLIMFMCFMFTSFFAYPFVRKADAVFASNPQTLVAFPGSVYARLVGGVLVLNVDDLWPESLYDLGMLKSGTGHLVGDLVARTAYSLVDCITPISSGYVETLTEKYSIARSKIEVIPGGVDMRLFDGWNKERDSETFQVLYVGAFSKAYDFDQVLHAAADLAVHPEIRFVFQGAGEMSAHLKSVVKSMGLTNVLVSDNVVPRKEAASMMMSSDVLIVPLAGTGNIEKGFSSKIYEYQAAGRPIICCSRGVAGIYVAATRSGFVVEPGDYKAVAKAVLFLYSHKAEAIRLGTRGRGVVQQNYTMEAVGRSLITLIEALNRKFKVRKILVRQTAQGVTEPDPLTPSLWPGSV